MRVTTLLADGAPGVGDVLGQFERRRLPVQRLAGRGHLVPAERAAVDLLCPLLMGRALADDCLAADQGRQLVPLRLGQRGFDAGMIVAVAFDHVPAGRPIPRWDILAGR